MEGTCSLTTYLRVTTYLLVDSSMRNISHNVHTFMLYVWILDAIECGQYMKRLDTWMWNNENHFTTQIEMVSFVWVILTCFQALKFFPFVFTVYTSITYQNKIFNYSFGKYKKSPIQFSHVTTLKISVTLNPPPDIDLCVSH